MSVWSSYKLALAFLEIIFFFFTVYFFKCCQRFSLFCCCFFIKLPAILKGNIKVTVVKETFMTRLGSIPNDLEEVFFEAIYLYSGHFKLK